ncbi:MAG: glycosyltransferase [Candidatus Eisenbacteria bacterium]|nr:glycosyltransferase [Candidatus Eisenbacteria bacterium]
MLQKERAGDDRPGRDKVGRLLVPDRGQLPLLEKGILDPGDPHRVRRSPLRHIEDVETDRLGSDVARLAAQAGEDLQKNVKSDELPDLSIVTVGYRSRGPLRGLLDSIEETAGPGVETLVVDNASDDGTAQMVRGEYPRVRLLENSTNFGYSRAVNQGIRESRGRYVLVLNPDVRVAPGALDALTRFMDTHPDAGIAAAKLLNEDGTVQDSCRRFYTFWTLLLRRTFLGRIFPNAPALRSYLMADFDHEEVREVDWVLGACMMVRREALEDFGLMDERFFLYFEDVDWCYRAWKSGWKVYYVPQAVMRHRYARGSARRLPSRLLLAHLVSLFHFYEKWGNVAYWMKKNRTAVRRGALLFSDLLSINGAFALSYLLRSSMRGLLTKPMFGVEIYQTFLIFANIVLLFSFGLFGMYDRRTEREEWPDVFLKALKATAVAAVILMASTFLTSQTVYSRVLVGVFCVLTVLLVTALRMVLRSFHRAIQAGSFDLRRVVVAGTGPEAERVAGRVARHGETGYDLVGLIDTGGGGAGFGVPVVGKLEDLPRLLGEHRIAEVIFADPELSNERIADFLLETRRSPVDVKMLSGFSDILTLRARVEEFLDLPIVSFEREAMLRAGAGVKRLIDVISAAVLLALAAPFMAVTSLVTLLSGRGGPFEKEKRLGRDGRAFDIFRLRRTDRAGPLRRFVVRHGLSRAPELVNVLRGDMSFVGPRPLAPEEAAGLGARSSIRFDARPGIASPPTALSAEDAPDSAERDMEIYYVQSWSLGADIRILLRWLGRCLSGRCG